MRAVFGLVLVIGMGLAGFAVYMVKGYFEQQQVALARERAASAQQVPTVEVIAVNRAMSYGEQITKDDVQFIRYAEPFLPEGVFYTGEELFPEGGDALRTVLRPMEPNEPILAVKVTEPGQGAGITSRLGAGMRAFAIKVDVSTGVSGFLRPGDNVDVYWSGRVPSGNGDGQIPVTRLIETGTRIVAVDQSADDTLNRAMVARKKGVPLDEAALLHLLNVKYPTIDNIYANYQPVFLIDQMISICEFEGIPYQMTPELIDRAWANMFVREETIVH